MRPRRLLLLSFCFALAEPSWAMTRTTKGLMHQDHNPQPSPAYKWLDVALEASARDGNVHGDRPTIESRRLAIVLTAMYDAWAAYDAKAMGTRLGGRLRQAPQERTVVNREAAISYAAHRALRYAYPHEAAWLDQQMRGMGYDPAADGAGPAGVGHAAADAVIAYRRRDGSNQDGDETGSDGRPYSDYTFYRPRNTPDAFVDPGAWLPIPHDDGNGGTVRPGFLTPHWYRVRPFALERADRFRPPAPPPYGSEEHIKEVEEALEAVAGLTLERKAAVEFMRDARSAGAPGLWLRFAQDVSRREAYGLDQDVRLFFAVANAVFDSIISCWDAKRFHDAGRPYWWVRLYHKGASVKGWAGPGKGTADVPAEEWRPYAPAAWVAPPSPGYVSERAAAAGAAAKVLELSTGSDALGAAAPRRAGELTEDRYSVNLIQAQDGKPAAAPGSREVQLDLATFSAAAQLAADSGLWAGLQIRSDNEEGLKLGRAVASHSWPKYKAYFDGTAAEPDEAFTVSAPGR